MNDMLVFDCIVEEDDWNLGYQIVEMMLVILEPKDTN